MNMMNLNHSSPAAKTAQIMSRYRPIAPKPESSSTPSLPPSNPIFHHPHKQPRTLWPSLQARPSRIRKKTRSTTTGLGLTSPPPLTFKRRIKPSMNILTLPQWPLIEPAPGPGSGLGSGPIAVVTAAESLVTLPLLACSPPPVIDLNVIADDEPPSQPKNTTTVISPQPVRPVGSSIRVRLINKDESNKSKYGNFKKAEDVEEEVESELLPAVISDSNNRVRLTNSAYKEMVGQPECSWLDATTVNDGRRPCKRISGEVMLRFSDCDSNVAVLTTGFSCWVNIEWGNNDEAKNSVNVFCDVMKLVCETKDCSFAWRFHTRASEHASFVAVPAPEAGSSTRTSTIIST